MSDPLRRALVSVRSISKCGEQVAVFARSHRAVCGKGWSFDIAEPAMTGAETLLGILASDILCLFLEICRKRRITVDELEATVKAELVDPLVHLGVVGAEGEPRYDAFSLKAYIGTHASAQGISQAWEDAVARAPLANTLRRSANLEISHQII